MEALETERLIIRPFVMDDLEAAYQLLDIDIQWSGPGFSLERRKAQLQFYIYLSAWNDMGRLYGYRAIILKPSQKLIGICGFLPSVISPRQKWLFWPALFGESDPDSAFATPELEVGYAMSSLHRGNGYATEAVRALIQYAFAELGVKRLFASTNRSNTGSIKLMKRVGMRTANNPVRLDEDWPDAPGVIGVIENPLI